METYMFKSIMSDDCKRKGIKMHSDLNFLSNVWTVMVSRYFEQGGLHHDTLVYEHGEDALECVMAYYNNYVKSLLDIGWIISDATFVSDTSKVETLPCEGLIYDREGLIYDRFNTYVTDKAFHGGARYNVTLHDPHRYSCSVCISVTKPAPKGK